MFQVTLLVMCIEVWGRSLSMLSWSITQRWAPGATPNVESGMALAAENMDSPQKRGDTRELYLISSAGESLASSSTRDEYCAVLWTHRDIRSLWILFQGSCGIRWTSNPWSRLMTSVMTSTSTTTKWPSSTEHLRNPIWAKIVFEPQKFD